MYDVLLLKESWMRKMKNVVEVKNVVKSFKDKIVLNHVFSMKLQEIVGFVDKTVQGKAILMKCNV